MHPIGKVVLLALALLATGRAAEVKNLKVGQAGDKALATYDLVGKKGERTAEVAVTIAINGQVNQATQLHLAGAFGKGVPVGKGRKIFWDVTKDLPADFDYENGDLQWNVEVPAAPQEARPGKLADPGAAGPEPPVPVSGRKANAEEELKIVPYVVGSKLMCAVTSLSRRALSYKFQVFFNITTDSNGTSSPANAVIDNPDFLPGKVSDFMVYEAGNNAVISVQEVKIIYVIRK